MGIAVGVLLGQFALAFLALELVFRFIDLTVDGLRGRLRRWGWGYFGAAAVGVGLGVWVQWWYGGVFGLVVAFLGWVPWWILWRFGIRKQLTFLFVRDGDRAR